ncbi:MAG: transposase family protein [Verrucomicrobiales bacterium]|nr:transposase family protein [Verrucomicrobiales bacterium]
MATGQLFSLWQCFAEQMHEPRRPKGLRHPLATVLSLIALAVAAGSDGPHAIAEFAASLNHGQRWQLRCRPRLGLPGNATCPASAPSAACSKD